MSTEEKIKKPASKAGGKSSAKAAPRPVAGTTPKAKAGLPGAAGRLAKPVGINAGGGGGSRPLNPVAAVADLKKKELIEQVIAMTGIKKGDARHAVEAVLTVIRGTLALEGEVSASPLGKLRVVRQKTNANGTVLICRVKLADPDGAPRPKPAKLLAEPDEEG